MMANWMYLTSILSRTDGHKKYFHILARKKSGPAPARPAARRA